MRSMRRSTRNRPDKFLRLAALLLALCLMPVLPARGEADEDFMRAVEEYNEREAEATPEPEPVDIAADADMAHGDVTIGYVARTGAQLNPLACTERDLVSLNSLVFESVVGLDDNMQPVPLLADSWTSSGRIWTFKLRSGVLFHTGEEMVAADVVETFSAFKQVSDGNPFAARIKLIESMEATEPFTLTVKSRYDGLITLYAMTFPVIQRSTLQDELPRGTGPYWYIGYEQDASLRLERNPLWWKLQPEVASVVGIRFAETADALEALRTGLIDTFGTRSASAAINRKLSNVAFMDYTTCTYEALVPNLRSTSSMADVRVRRAAMYAIDRTTLVENAYLGMGQQSEVPVIPGSWIYESQSAVYNYSPERALQLLREAGWSNLTDEVMLSRLSDGYLLEDLKVSLYTYDEGRSSVRSNAAQQIAQNLRAVGIDTTVTVTTRSEVVKAIRNGNCDLALIAMNLSEVPNMTPLFTRDGSLNLSGYVSQTLTGLVNGTATAVTEDEFRKAFSDLQLFVAEELPLMGLLYRTGTLLSTRPMGGLTGIRESSMLRGLEFVAEE